VLISGENFLAKKKAWITFIQAKEKQERDLNAQENLRVKVELNDHAGFFSRRLILPLNHGGHYGLDQHRISAQDFYVLHSAIGRDQQLNAGASYDVVSFGQFRINGLHAVFDFARNSLRKGIV